MMIDEALWKTVDWDEIKNIAICGDYSYDDLPFSYIEKQEWQRECKTVELKPGQIFVKPNEKIPGIYILLKGRVGIGEKEYGYCIERMAIEPFSFLGEAEAPLKIAEKDFPHSFPQQWAWVTSDTLSRLIAFGTEPYTLRKVPGAGWTLKFLQQQYDELVSGDEENYTIMSEQDRYADEPAILFKIPLERISALWADNKCREWICHDAFIKSKKFLLMPRHDDAISNVRDATQQIISLYNHVKMNGHLDKGILYVLGNERLKAILSTSLRLDVRKQMNALCDELKKKSFKIDSVDKLRVRDVDKNIPIRELGTCQ